MLNLIRLTKWSAGIIAVFVLIACGSSANSNDDVELISSQSTSVSSSSFAPLSVSSNESSNQSNSSSSQSNKSSSVIKYSSSVEAVNSSSSISIQSSSSIKLSSSSRTIVFGTFIDTRDNQSYKTVVIGTQTWMGSNLNYSGDLVNGSRSYTIGYCPQEIGLLSYNTSHNDLPSCDTYGRLYDWTTAMNGAAPSEAVPSGVKGICPSGWHLPSLSEWMTLKDYADLADDGMMNSTIGIALKDSIGWYEDSITKNGIDAVGFAFKPAGNFTGNQFRGLGLSGAIWLTTEYTTKYSTQVYAYQAVFDIYNSLSNPDFYGKNANYSIRCLHD